jgi:hypothetical protein
MAETNGTTVPQLRDADPNDPDGTHLVELAWGLAANVSGGDWTRQPEWWQAQARDWRDDYHAALTEHPQDQPLPADVVLDLLGAAWEALDRVDGPGPEDNTQAAEWRAALADWQTLAATWRRRHLAAQVGA